MPARSLDQIVSLSKRRGFVFPGSAAYGGLGSFWDYGPLGSELMRNVKDAWWKAMTWDRDDIEGVDCAILMNRKVWQHSGHEATFSDPLVDNKKSKMRHRLDKLLESQNESVLEQLFKNLVSTIDAVHNTDEIKRMVPTPECTVGWVTIALLRLRTLLHPLHTIVDPLYLPEQGTNHGKSIYPSSAPNAEAEIEFFGVPNNANPTGCVARLTVSEALKRQTPPIIDGIAKALNKWPEFISAGSSFDAKRYADIATRYYYAEAYIADLMNASGLVDPATNEVGNWTTPRSFNLMFKSHVGAIESAAGTEEELASRVYLRPETAQGIFMNFKNVLESSRKKVPFGIAQIGKSFRNEITPGNFTFRTREFEQMEMEFFIKPPQFVKPGEKNDDQWHEEWVNSRYSWWVTYGIPTERLRKRAQDKSELAHYAKATTDIEYLFPGALGWGEVEGIANRTDYDLTAHSRDIPEADLKRLHLEPNKDSVTTLDYFDTEAKARYMPWVIEPAAGATRAALTFLCE
nr:glycine--tRNA ligase [Planctomycetota bacterium]